ncbi:MAG TPA: pyridoxal-phosphate dependent enzyme [Gemmatimonadales bacterium]|nr:pyridoxal-phosphate dependent enzyme [Gemmatimonadales bacterium]
MNSGPMPDGPDFHRVARPTTFIRAPRLSERLGAEVTLATETFQITGSFKFRAAYRVAASVEARELIAASSGNFGQALAAACRLFGKRCTIVMPAGSARVKIEAVCAAGGVVELVDTARTSRAERVRRLAAERPNAYVASAYDDPLVIAGNATLGAELAAEAVRAGGFEAVIAPVGGGGLSAGIVVGLRAAGDATPVWGAEPALGNDAAESLRQGRLVANPSEPATLADGARTLSLGAHNWTVLRTGLAGIVEVGEDAIAESVRLLFSLANLKAEPTGALAVAALLAAAGRWRGRVCCVVSGGNVDPELYAALLAAPGAPPAP